MTKKDIIFFPSNPTREDIEKLQEIVDKEFEGFYAIEVLEALSENITWH